MRVIDADALKENVEKYRIVHLSHRRLSAIKREAEEVINDICLGIDFAPTINPVKHGRWEPWDLSWGRSVWSCSECRDAMEVPTEMGDPIYKFCPNCGARMQEGEEDEERLDATEQG